ncbi:MAG: hypothetical protein DSM107014_08635 [Gomphosphaeria aponina SAG 52.96 = DSM 107014]|uniref:Uncharacterized protein n=1 Tax=Gomphosphaeria aponina SAG 52.96 = DSM 107014 TaxID=1521640 RepID=A0A941JT48_9CHRO|nr:hypothetical protein [Gomphosphaeria aponina SAG 52.96 = DSM 107014]
MSESDQVNKNNFLYPQSRYHGKFSPEALMFNANLQDFAQGVSYIAGLHTGGKISSAAAYAELKRLWQELQHSHDMIGVIREEESS